jgi:hypothetical protein
VLERPIFVIGTMRSGSTLFRLILDAHPNIAIGEETGFMGALAATKRIPNWQHGRGWYERLGWTGEEFDDRLREFYAGLFERHAVSQGKTRWGEKTPFHSAHMQQMAAVFPDAVFAGIVRHPGAVVHSLVRKFHFGVADAAAYWASTNQEILRRGMELGDDRFALLRYEDLVGRPEPTLRELLEWLQEPWSEDVLRHNDVHASRGTPRISAGATRTRDPIITELADRWIDGLAEPDLDVLASKTGALAEFFGYDPRRPGVRGPLTPDGEAGPRMLLTGARLARRGAAATALLDRVEEPMIMPDMDAAELAKRLQQAETALARVRSRRAVQWGDALRRTQRRVSGLPGETVSLVGQSLRRRGQMASGRKAPTDRG